MLSPKNEFLSPDLAKRTEREEYYIHICMYFTDSDIHSGDYRTRFKRLNVLHFHHGHSNRRFGFVHPWNDLPMEDHGDH